MDSALQEGKPQWKLTGETRITGKLLPYVHVESADPCRAVEPVEEDRLFEETNAQTGKAVLNAGVEDEICRNECGPTYAASMSGLLKEAEARIRNTEQGTAERS